MSRSSDSDPSVTYHTSDPFTYERMQKVCIIGFFQVVHYNRVSFFGGILHNKVDSSYSSC